MFRPGGRGAFKLAQGHEIGDAAPDGGVVAQPHFMKRAAPGFGLSHRPHAAAPPQGVGDGFEAGQGKGRHGARLTEAAEKSRRFYTIS